MIHWLLANNCVQIEASSRHPVGTRRAHCLLCAPSLQWDPAVSSSELHDIRNRFTFFVIAIQSLMAGCCPLDPQNKCCRTLPSRPTKQMLPDVDSTCKFLSCFASTNPIMLGSNYEMSRCVRLWPPPCAAVPPWCGVAQKSERWLCTASAASSSTSFPSDSSSWSC